jgi:aspartyl-tRNA(Asn)/glutamyl-tRNA(Gln) amidotransferase subunit C
MSIKVTDETVDRIAQLAKLEFDGEERASIKQDLERILGFVDQLNEVDTEGVEPLIYMLDEADTLREDEVTYSFTQEQALKNAPDKDTDYFKVPKVLGKSGQEE